MDPLLVYLSEQYCTLSRKARRRLVELAKYSSVYNSLPNPSIEDLSAVRNDKGEKKLEQKYDRGPNIF